MRTPGIAAALAAALFAPRGHTILMQPGSFVSVSTQLNAR